MHNNTSWVELAVHTVFAIICAVCSLAVTWPRCISGTFFHDSVTSHLLSCQCHCIFSMPSPIFCRSCRRGGESSISCYLPGEMSKREMLGIQDTHSPSLYVYSLFSTIVSGFRNYRVGRKICGTRDAATLYLPLTTIRPGNDRRKRPRFHQMKSWYSLGHIVRSSQVRVG